MQALILAGGLGTRLRAVVSDKPKPMAAIADKPFLEYQLELLKRDGITEVTFCVGYLYEQIRNYFGHGDAWDLKISYSIETELLGTAGALKLAERFIHGPFLVLNGDTFLDVDLRRLLQFYREKKEKHNAFGVMALTEVPDAGSYGSVTVNAEAEIASFNEKSAGVAASKLINAGIYVLAPEILPFIPAETKSSLEKEIFPALLNQGHRLFGYHTAGYFVDIGTPAGYQGFQQYIAGKG
ncbi:MAG: D-glycero-alpha-D-manno-heptose 1-phosphate guanylyltransferase [bacterium]|nr:D-glycero-alpha-D-manno-heptose 1-phosphate guanylyltransferase [bacterium]